MYSEASLSQCILAHSAGNTTQMYGLARQFKNSHTEKVMQEILSIQSVFSFDYVYFHGYQFVDLTGKAC